jgi:hypothetical protein
MTTEGIMLVTCVECNNKFLCNKKYTGCHNVLNINRCRCKSCWYSSSLHRHRVRCFDGLKKVTEAEMIALML